LILLLSSISLKNTKKYINIVKPLFTEIDSGNIEAITSTISLLEVLVHPLRTGNEALAEKYREILLYSKGLTTFEIFNEVSEVSAKLRAKYSIKTPDAIQLATGVLSKADRFLTNDPNLKKISEIKVLILDNFVKE